MKTLRTIIVLLGCSLLLLIQTECSGNKKPVEGLPWIPTDLASSADLLNKKCPEMVDPESRLDSVKLLAEGLFFYYSLPNKEESEIASAAFTAYLIPGIIDNIRNSPRMEMFYDSSVVMNFIYRDRDGQLITGFSVEPRQYK